MHALRLLRHDRHTLFHYVKTHLSQVPQAVAHHEEITTVSNEATQLLQKKARTRIPTIRIRGPSLAIAQEPT